MVWNQESLDFAIVILGIWQLKDRLPNFQTQQVQAKILLFHLGITSELAGQSGLEAWHAEMYSRTWFADLLQIPGHSEDTVK